MRIIDKICDLIVQLKAPNDPKNHQKGSFS